MPDEKMKSNETLRQEAEAARLQAQQKAKAPEPVPTPMETVRRVSEQLKAVTATVPPSGDKNGKVGPR